MNNNILEVKNLHTSFKSRNGSVEVIRGVDFEVRQGEILGIVGESGSGKSVTVSSVMRILGNNVQISGEVILDGKNLLDLTEKEMRSVRGKKISMIFQDPMTALNPVYTIGNQIRETIKLHRNDIDNPTEYAAQLLEEVGISDGKKRLKQYPHELSGGMRQRVMIAMALASNPDILVADEPTTALDVTVQAQILELIKKLTKEKNMTTLLITHDLGVVADMCDRIIIMYAGKICEKGTVEEIFRTPKHEYTKGLLLAVPDGKAEKKLIPIEGTPVNIKALPDGCAFCTRCTSAMKICEVSQPEVKAFSETHSSACWVNERPCV